MNKLYSFKTASFPKVLDYCEYGLMLSVIGERKNAVFKDDDKIGKGFGSGSASGACFLGRDFSSAYGSASGVSLYCRNGLFYGSGLGAGYGLGSCLSGCKGQKDSNLECEHGYGCACGDASQG